MDVHVHLRKSEKNSTSQEREYVRSRQKLCANCVILRGTKIGDNCVIGAGTVVKGEIPANSVVYQERNNRMKIREI